MVFPSRKNASSAQPQQSPSSSPESKSPKKKFGFGRKNTEKYFNNIDDQATALNISYVQEPYVKVHEIDPVQPTHNTEEKVLHSDFTTASATVRRDDCCSTLDTFYEIFFGGEGEVDIIECSPPCSIDDNVDIIECTNTGCNPTSFGTAATSCSPWSSNSSWNPNFFQEEDAGPEPEGTGAGDNVQPILRLRCQA